MRLSLLFFFVLICHGEIIRLDGSRLSEADADAFAQKTLEANHVTGAQIAVLNRGKVVWSAAYGLRRRDPALPMTRETTTWAASITKSVFATYVMQLVERNLIDLDKPVAQQLAKPLDQYEPYREPASAIVNDPRWKTVTPRMLLSHTSGLFNFAFMEPDKKMRLRFQPGTQFLYSGEAMNVVQFLVEQKLGQPLQDLMSNAIFEPLRMTRTEMIYNQRFADNVADRYDADQKFLSQTRRFPARASGNMTSSADDIARFLTALFEGRIVKKATIATMFRPVIQIRTVHQFGGEPGGAEAERVGLAYGIGWGLLTKTPYGPAFFKEGHGDGAQNYLICFERSRSCMVILTNSDNGELAFRPLLETILGDTVTPWEWEGYTPELIRKRRLSGN